MAVAQTKPMAMVGRKHDALHRPADTVVDFDEARDLAERMRVTLGRRNGSGLAAAQVGRPLNLIVLGRAQGDHAYANVAIIATGGGQILGPEGCLTIPGRWYNVPRWRKVTVTATDIDVEADVELKARDLLARCWQHEADHLAGLLLIGRFDELRR